MRYDEIFENGIETYTDDEIRERAMVMRADAKLTRGKGGKKKAPVGKKAKENKTETMLEQMMNTARKVAEKGDTNEPN